MAAFAVYSTASKVLEASCTKSFHFHNIYKVGPLITPQAPHSEPLSNRAYKSRGGLQFYLVTHTSQ